MMANPKYFYRSPIMRNFKTIVLVFIAFVLVVVAVTLGVIVGTNAPRPQSVIGAVTLDDHPICGTTYHDKNADDPARVNCNTLLAIPTEQIATFACATISASTPAESRDYCKGVATP